MQHQILKILDIEPHEWMPLNIRPCNESFFKQEAQLSQRNRATLRVIEYFAKSLMVTQGHSRWQLSRACASIPLKQCLYLVPFLRYSASKNGVTIALSCIISEIKHWLKIVIFHTTLTFDAPVRGSPLEYCHHFGTENVAPADGEKSLTISLAV